MNRREFLKVTGAVAGSGLVASRAGATAAEQGATSTEFVGVLVDTTRCIGCRSCELACSREHGMYEPDIENDRKGRRSLILIQQGHIGEAIEYCCEALQQDPAFAVGWNNLGFCLARQGSIISAMRCYCRAIEAWPEYPEAWNNLGAVLSDLGRFEQALECSTRALEHGPKGAMRLSNHAGQLSKLNRFEAAIQVLRYSLAIYPSCRELMVEYCRIRAEYGSRLDDLQEGAAKLEKNRRDPEALVDVAFAHINLGRYREAEAGFDRALHLDGRIWNAWFGKGHCRRKLKRYREAIAYLDRALELGASDVDSSQEGVWHDKGLCLAAVGELGAALEAFERLLEVSPEHPYAWFDKALVEERLERWEAAEASYRRGVALQSHWFEGQGEWAQQRIEKFENGDFTAAPKIALESL